MKNKTFEALAQSFSEGNRQYLDTNVAEDLIDYLLNHDRRDEALAISDYATSLHKSATGLLIQRSIILIEYDRLEEALEILRYVTPIEQKNPDLHIAWGDLHMQDGDYNKGIECYDKAIECETDPENYCETLLMVASRLNRDDLELWKHVPKYAKLYFAKKPDDPDMLFELAYAKDKCDKLDESMEIYLKILKQDPYYDSAWYNYALLCTRCGYFDKAETAFKNAIALNPDYNFAYVNYGNLLLTEGKYDLAIEKYTLYISLAKNTPEFDVSVYQLLADCLHMWAVFEYEEQNGADGNIGMTIPEDKNICDILALAKEVYHILLEHHFEESHALLQLADTYSILGEHDKGLKFIDRAIEMEDKNSTLYYMKAAILERKGEYDECIPPLLTGINYDEAPMCGWLECAKILYKIADNDDSLELVDAYTMLEDVSNKFSYTHLPYIIITKCFLLHIIGKDNNHNFEVFKSTVAEYFEIFWDALSDPDFQKMMDAAPYNTIDRKNPF
ncbi:MAG: tetratricopeptide repeat protein [Bacteroidia bacterium]|nr:tetratricopeptide repeat protein [Bacteroidia bacterium]